MASNQLQNAGLAVVFVLGFVFFLKGFGIYDKIVRFKPKLPPPEEQVMYVARIIGAIVSIVGIYQGIISATNFIPSPVVLNDLSWWAGMLPTFISEFTLKGIDLIILGFGVYLIGGAVFHYMRKDELIAQSIVTLNLAFWIRLIMIESAEILRNPSIEVNFMSPLIFYTLGSILTTIILVFITYRRYKRLPFT
jgi:uncharacterized membrane protein